MALEQKIVSVVDALDCILSVPNFYGDVLIRTETTSSFARVCVDGREPFFLKFMVLEGMYGIADVFLEEARLRLDIEPSLQFVGPAAPSSSFQAVRPGKLRVFLLL
jgi:hypothetical protein